MRNSLLSLSLLLLISCVSTSTVKPWPQSIPDRDYFQLAYLADKSNGELQTEPEYLNWVITFYVGTDYLPFSWKIVETDVLDQVSHNNQQPLQQQLYQLGLSISQEWAKDNSIRKVNTSMLTMWGEVLRVAVAEEKINETIELISQDVTGLLSSQILKEAVTSTRYQDLLGIDLFADF